MYIYTASMQCGKEIKAGLEIKNRMGLKSGKKDGNKK